MSLVICLTLSSESPVRSFLLSVCRLCSYCTWDSAIITFEASGEPFMPSVIVLSKPPFSSKSRACFAAFGLSTENRFPCRGTGRVRCRVISLAAWKVEVGATGKVFLTAERSAKVEFIVGSFLVSLFSWLAAFLSSVSPINRKYRLIVVLQIVLCRGRLSTRCNPDIRL